ncbi:MAG: UDP-N-acetylglucosamine 2-epimerase (hydrolyzing) [Bacteroidetes bacterium]|nr:UDP-N-acetylglucosamine 2-epimerase (hydrolyzing) [Bacteroidota bacterium]
MKKLLFLTGTRADFGKIKSLIEISRNHPGFEVHIFATGMHVHEKYGLTVKEIEKSEFDNIHTYQNFDGEESMDEILANTIHGLSAQIKKIKPDMIVIHGDRVEALAGAIVGSLNNIFVAHIEGGEVSGTIDELIRHSVSKLSHFHLVANELAQKRLLQMGEREESVFVIGSPDVDIMFSDKLESLEFVKSYYEIPFKEFGILMFHPVTTEVAQMEEYAQNLVRAVIDSKKNYVVIAPNNDLGSEAIFEAYKILEGQPNIRMFPSLRFEYFLVLLKHSQFLLGNSSTGIREAPYYGIPSINIGTRQQNRSLHQEIINCDYTSAAISLAIKQALKMGRYAVKNRFGSGKSDEQFLKILSNSKLWKSSKQKLFKDR